MPSTATIALLCFASAATTFVVPTVPKPLATSVRMAGSCDEVATSSLGATYACTEPQGLGSEQEVVKGKVKWMRYPAMPKATLGDVKDACVLFATEGSPRYFRQAT